MYYILGHSVNFKKGENTELPPEEIVNYLNEEISALKNSSPGLKDDKIAILLLLKLAEKNLRLSKDYKDNLAKLKFTTYETLEQIESVIS